MADTTQGPDYEPMTEITKPCCYDEMLPQTQRAWDDHDKTCASMPHFWHGCASGGPVAIEDVDECSDCRTIFFREDLQPGREFGFTYLCECCARAEQ